MSTPVRASDQDLRALAAIVSEDRPDLPDGEGLPPSLLADLMDQIRCDEVASLGFDSGRQAYWFGQEIPPTDDDSRTESDLDRAYWEHYWDSQPCSYPDRTGDLRSIIKITDFYSARQWHSTGMYTDHDRPRGSSTASCCACPKRHRQTAGPGRTVRLYFDPRARAGLLRA